MIYRLAAIAIFALAASTESKSETLGAIRNDIGGLLMFMSDQPAPCAGAYRVESRNRDGTIRHLGCYAIHNRVSVVVLWDNGPAHVIPFSAVEWVQDAPKAIGAPDKTL